MEKRRIAIVTGASSGFGREFVRLLVKDDTIDEIWAVARAQERLEKLVSEFGSKVKPYSVDLADKEALNEFGDKIKMANGVVCYLVNNAGYAKFCSYNDLSIEDSLNMMELNCSAVVAMGLFCIPFMERGSHIINVASQASFQPLPYLNLYSASKAFVRNYSRSLNVELRDKGVTVTAVCPGWMDTALYDRATIGAEKTIQQFRGMVKPDKVAEKALRDARKGKDISVYGWRTKISHFVAKILPQRAMMKLWLWQQKM
ncbi:MAG: SDR family NAD(P)-dependent oxidoreductase [Clostridiales bacterium]|nr:SDR family NAD(P)-dependent oxidoreductase [Clostridiales bacterium]